MLFSECLVEVDVSFDNEIGVVTTVFAILSDTVHEGSMSTGEFSADWPIPRPRRRFAEEEKDGITGRELELLGFNPGGPVVEFAVLGVDMVRVQSIDFLFDGFLDGFLVFQVQPVEFGIGVAEFCGIDHVGGGIERLLRVVERSQFWDE